jgi:glycerol-3-phosphate dehydrogenase (NAD(P)+)
MNTSAEGQSPTSPQSVAILGAGAWGSTLAMLAQGQGHRVRVWNRRKGLDLAEVLQGSQILISAVSMAGVRPVVEAVRQVGSHRRQFWSRPPKGWIHCSF